MEPLAVPLPEAMRLIGVRKDEVARLVRSGQIASYLAGSGGKRLYVVESLRAYVARASAADRAGRAPQQP